MIKELRSSIEKLSESEAKTFLLHALLRIKMLEESKDSKEQMLEDLYAMYNRILTFQKKSLLDIEYDAVHIVVGEAAAGSLRVGLGHKHQVIGFPEYFAIGPIWRMHTEEGLRKRYEWLKEHINAPMDYFEEEYQSRIANALGEIDAIPEDVPIVIWTTENANEQTGMRYFIHLLQEKSNDIYTINTTIAFGELFNKENVRYVLKHSGEAHPEQLKFIYEKKLGKPLSLEEKSRLQQEWAALSNTKEVLRIWENRLIKGVPENYFDQFIIETAQKLHTRQENKGFMKAARLIGGVYGLLDDYVNDTFLEYRVRCLLYDQVFEIKGIPKGMRYYSVRLR